MLQKNYLPQVFFALVSFALGMAVSVLVQPRAHRALPGTPGDHALGEFLDRQRTLLLEINEIQRTQAVIEKLATELLEASNSSRVPTGDQRTADVEYIMAGLDRLLSSLQHSRLSVDQTTEKEVRAEHETLVNDLSPAISRALELEDSEFLAAREKLSKTLEETCRAWTLQKLLAVFGKPDLLRPTDGGVRLEFKLPLRSEERPVCAVFFVTEGLVVRAEIQVER